MKFNQMRVTTRLWLLVGVIVFALIALIAFAAIRTAAITAATTSTLGAVDAKTRAAARWAALVETNIVRVEATAIGSDALVDGLFKPRIASTIEEIGVVQKSIESMPLSTEERALLDGIATLRKSVLDGVKRLREARLAGQTAAITEEFEQRFNPAVAAYLKGLREFVQYEQAQGELVKQNFAQARQGTVAIASGCALLVIIGLLGGALWLGRSIQRPLDEAIGVADRIAHGDLAVDLKVDRKDEFGVLLSSLQTMARSLAGLVGQVQQAAESISTASSEIATGNHDLSQRTEQTASSLQQTSASIEQLTGTVRQTADSARTANQLASAASEVAGRGGKVVAQVVATMEEINHSSRRIADIIGTIDGIAFQTNILALNAAVEAARAGEQGRGFAVVAAEVRSLAQRSAEAAREIKSLIGASVDRVEAGTRLVGDAGSTMTELVASVQHVSDIIGEISAAAAEQSAGIGQVNGAVTSLDHMTQQNAALVEQSTAAAESLTEQAARLGSLVGTFRLRAA